MAARLLAHWLSFAPLILIACLPGAALLSLTGATFWRLMLSLLAGTPGLAALGLITAALLASLRGGTALAGLLRELGLDNVDQLACMLERPGEHHLATKVVEALLNNETYFFRDHVYFAVLANQVLSDIASRRAARPRSPRPPSQTSCRARPPWPPRRPPATAPCRRSRLRFRCLFLFVPFEADLGCCGCAPQASGSQPARALELAHARVPSPLLAPPPAPQDRRKKIGAR